VGDAGDDRIVNPGGRDLIHGGPGDDTVTGGDQGDVLLGNQGDDWLQGGAAGDFMFGGKDGDRLFGGAGGDRLWGDRGDDRLAGEDGDDTLEGGDGADTLIGGAGRDRFVFASLDDSRPGSADRLLDFASAEDLIDLSAIDADRRSPGDDAFVLVGAFDGRAGRAVLSYDEGRGLTTLRLDVDGDRQPDFELLIAGRVDSATGFVF
jgi:Ca2+-binding RTX toxin-like protein